MLVGMDTYICPVLTVGIPKHARVSHGIRVVG